MDAKLVMCKERQTDSDDDRFTDRKHSSNTRMQDEVIPLECCRMTMTTDNSDDNDDDETHNNRRNVVSSL